MLTAAFFLLGWAAWAPAAEMDRNNVVIVLDASGSMGDTMRGTLTVRMDAAKEALKQVLRQVPEDTNIGLLVFGSAQGRTGWIYPLGPRDDEVLARAIDLPVPRGGTPLGRFIRLAANRLLEQRREQSGYGTYRLLVVTDGEAGDPDLVEQYVPEVIARGITLDVIGVDMATTHTLATRAHSYRRADDPESLKQAVAEVFAEVSGQQSDAVGREAFGVLAGIPDELAAAMVKSLSSTGNQPIGLESGGGLDEAAKPSPSQQPTPSAAPSTQTGPPAGSGNWPTGYILIVAAIVVLLLLPRVRRDAKVSGKKGRRSHGR